MMPLEQTLLVLVVLFPGLLTPAQDLTCKVTQTGNVAVCQLEHTDAFHDVEWMNASYFKLAFQDESTRSKDNIVLDFNQTHLLLLRCEKIVRFSGVDPEGTTHRATCTSSCSVTPPEPPGGWSWIYWVLLVVFLVLPFGIAIVCCVPQLRDKLTKCTFSKLPGREEGEQNDADVEQGRRI